MNRVKRISMDRCCAGFFETTSAEKEYCGFCKGDRPRHIRDMSDAHGGEIVLEMLEDEVVEPERLRMLRNG